LILAAWSALCCYWSYLPSNDFLIFTVFGDLLFGIHRRVYLVPHIYLLGTTPGGLHVYANYRWVQTGPVTLLVAETLRHLGPNRGLPVAVGIMSILVVGLIWVLERVASSRQDSVDPSTGNLIRITVLVGGLLVMPVWAQLAARYGHLDDALALFGAAVALWCVEARRPVLCGLALGLAVACKPWAIGFVPLLIAFRGRDRVRAAGTTLGVILSASLPFVIADWATLQSAKFNYFVFSNSPLVLFGSHPGALSPGWVRPTEIGLGLVLAVAAAAHRRWYAIPFVVVAARIALDPQTLTYYTAGLLVGALAIDLLGRRRPLPLASLGSFLVLITGIGIETSHQQAASRLFVGVAAVALVAWPQRTKGAPEDSASPGTISHSEEPVEAIL